MERTMIRGIKAAPRKKKQRLTAAMKDVNLLRQYGPPPTFKLSDAEDADYPTDYAAAMNWCNAALELKDSRLELILWLEQNTDFGRTELDAIKSLPDWKLITHGNVAYLANNGWPLRTTSFDFLNNGVLECLNEGEEILAAKQQKKQEQVDKPTVSVALTNYLDSCNLRGVVEDLIFPLGKEEYTQEKMLTLVKGCKAVVTDATAGYLQLMLDEVNLIGSDDQVTEGYANLKKAQVNKIKKDLDSAITLLKNNRLNAKAVNLGRKKKPRSALQQTLKMKFKEADDSYNVVSAKPAEMIGARKVIIFNTKTRKIGVYHALDEELGFTAKGTTLLGFDESLSTQKTLRKTNAVSVIDHLTSFRKATVRKVDKVFDALKTTATKLTGRFSNDIIILKVYK